MYTYIFVCHIFVHFCLHHVIFCISVKLRLYRGSVSNKSIFNFHVGNDHKSEFVHTPLHSFIVFTGLLLLLALTATTSKLIFIPQRAIFLYKLFLKSSLPLVTPLAVCGLFSDVMPVDFGVALDFFGACISTFFLLKIK